MVYWMVLERVEQQQAGQPAALLPACGQVPPWLSFS